MKKLFKDHLRSNTDIKSITMVTRPALDSFGSIVDRAKMFFMSDENNDNKDKNSNSEIKTVGPELSSNDVFNTIQLLKTKCEKPKSFTEQEIKKLLN